MTVLAITTCKRFDYFVECLTSWKKYCRGIKRIIVSDDNSGAATVLRMEETLAYIFPDIDSRVVLSDTPGLASNMNSLLTYAMPYSHVFYTPDDYILTEPINVRKLIRLCQAECLSQLVLSRMGVDDFYGRLSLDSVSFRLHVWDVGAYIPGKLTSWPGFALMPSIIAVKQADSFRDQNTVLDYAIRQAVANRSVGYFDVTTCHIGVNSAFKKNRTRK